MKDTTTITWEMFWPVKAEVRKAQEAGVDPTPEIANKYAEMRNHFVARFYYLVGDVATSMHHKIKEVEEDALGSMGVDGLYDAVDGYGAINPATGNWEGIDPKTNKPVKFETYAVYRIRGSILDAIRREDWVPRLVRQRSKKLTERRTELERKLGRIPTDDEVAEAVGVSLEDYRKMLDESSLRSVQSLNAMFSSTHGEGNNNEEMSIMDCICDTNVPEPVEVMEQKEMVSKLFGKNFTKVEKIIVDHYYYQGRSMKEIADMIGLSESRVSQMNSAIIGRLRERIRRNPEYFGPSVQRMLDETEKREAEAKARIKRKKKTPCLVAAKSKD